MTHFRHMSESLARRIDRTMLSLADAGNLDDLESRFLAESGKILPADCLCWNAWSPDWSRMLGCRSDEQHDGWLLKNHEVFNRYIGHHPVLAANPISATARQVMRMSDFQSPADFRLKNPFYHEAYRHLGFLYQISYAAASLGDRKVILSWSRTLSDFSEVEREVFHFMGRRLGMISRRIEARQQLDAGWSALCRFVDVRMPAGPVASLGPKDARLLAELTKGRAVGVIAREGGIRRDTVDKQLGVIRERLGLENHRQLLSALAELGKSVAPEISAGGASAAQTRLESPEGHHRILDRGRLPLLGCRT